MNHSAVRATLWTYEPAGWLFVRLVLAVEWIRAGWTKIGDAGWTSAPEGAAVQGFLNGAIEKSTAGEHPEVPHWYHDLIVDAFLPNAELFAYLVAYGELLVGIALAIGLLTRVSALAGIAMNLAYLWAGTTSTNPPLLLLGFGLVFFGQRVGWLGVDGWLLPWLRDRLPAGLLRLGREALFVLAALVGVWLALIASDWGTLLTVAALTAAVMLIALRFRAPRPAAAG